MKNAFLLALACMPLSGCWLFSSKYPDNWWDNPPDNPATFIGVSPGTDVQLRRTAAETDARAKAASFVQTQIQQLVELWAIQAWKNQGNPDALKGKPAGARNDELFTRGLTNQVVRGCRVVKYHYDEDGGNQYVLMILGDPKELVGQVFGNNASLLTDETLLETGVLKEQARKRLEDMLDKKAEELSKSREAALKAYTGAK